MVELILAFVLGVACTLFVQAATVARQLSVARAKPMDIVDAENVVRIQKWKKRRSETGKTFNRWA